MGSKHTTKLVSLDRLIVSPNGVHLSLCENCKNKDCGNPIIDKDVFVFGIKKKVKCYQTGRDPMLVIQCDGYMPEKRN